MSRSRRHNSYMGHATSISEKKDKRFANRKYRRRVLLAIIRGRDIMPAMREVTNVWDMSKDGRRWFDPRESPEYMRK